MTNTNRDRLKILGAGAGCSIMALATAFELAPAAAGGATSDANTACDNDYACAYTKNKGTGAGLRGASIAGNGVTGTTSERSDAEFGAAGIAGFDLAPPGSNNAGVFGKTADGLGVRGLASTGTGMLGQSNGGIGVWGTTLSNYSGVGTAGVFGEDNGSSSVAEGVAGWSETGTGVEGDSFEKGRYLNVAVYGLTFSSSITTYFPAGPPGGLFNSDIGAGVVAETSSSRAEALQAANFGGGPILRGYEGDTEVMEVDKSGNMTLAGNLTQHGNPEVATRIPTGGDVVMYAPIQTVASVEDVGETQLNHGQAYVRIDPNFAATTNRARPYMVFITPQGDTPGLYVSQKTATGFIVREHSGQSNVAFDYRIVAQPYRSTRIRLASAPTLSEHGFSGSVTRRKSELLASRRIANH